MRPALVASRTLSKREILVWTLVIVQGMALLFIWNEKDIPEQSMTMNVNAMASHSPEIERMLTMNDHPNQYYQTRKLHANDTTSTREPYYENALIHHKDAGFVNRVWRSNSSPSINSDLKRGSCWCSADEWCMCTPSLAVDVILTSGPDHVWLVRREDTGQLALMGGFTEVGETSEESVSRELREEMNIALPGKPVLFGVYGDSLRDARRHTTSVVYIVDIPESVVPHAGDDATAVQRVALDDVINHDFFIDHKNILNDYLTLRKRADMIANNRLGDAPPEPRSGDGEAFKRSVCPL